jgi:hypothetical protein
LLYLDEAGTSSPEPHSIYAGVLIKSSDWRKVEREIERVIDLHVPAAIRKGFVFHGKEVFNGGRTVDRSMWPLGARLAFFADFVSIPFRLDCPIAIGKTCRNSKADFALDLATELEFQNVMAFTGCLQQADKCVRYFSPPGQICVAVAEDNPPMRRLVAAAFLAARNAAPLRLLPEHTMDGKGALLETRSFVDVIHFVPKHGSPMLQLADACAFVMRRFLAAQDHGERLFLAMTGQPRVDLKDLDMWRVAPDSSASFHRRRIVKYSAHISWQQDYVAPAD